MNQANNTSETGSVNNGGMAPSSFTGDDGYKSFWDIYNRNREVFYNFQNASAESPGSPATRLIFEVTPYIGLAYSDEEVTDGLFYDSEDSQLKGDFAGSSSQFLNMYPPPTFNEIGNFVPAKPIRLSGISTNVTGPTWGSTDLVIMSTDHCHVDSSIIIPNIYNPNLIFFDISAPPAPYQPSTSLEQEFLAKYGKVFFYYWEARDPANPALVVKSGYIMPYCNTGDMDYWQDTTVPASNLPGITGTRKIFENIYCEDSGRETRELVLEEDTYTDVAEFTNPANGFRYRVAIETYKGGVGFPHDPSSGIYPNVGGAGVGGTASRLRLEVL